MACAFGNRSHSNRDKDQRDSPASHSLGNALTGIGTQGDAKSVCGGNSQDGAEPHGDEGLLPARK